MTGPTRSVARLGERAKSADLDAHLVEPCDAGSRRAGPRSHIVAVLPRGEAIRNFVYTGALDQVLVAVVRK